VRGAASATKSSGWGASWESNGQCIQGLARSRLLSTNTSAQLLLLAAAALLPVVALALPRPGPAR
jgi:hypothetical protein